MKKLIFIAVSLVFLSACTQSDKATRALESSGYTEIQTNGYKVFGCGDETFHTAFTAIGANGKLVSGVVCSGVFKGATVRLD